jgi:hypothetical protein
VGPGSGSTARWLTPRVALVRVAIDGVQQVQQAACEHQGRDPTASMFKQRSGGGIGHWSLWQMTAADYARLARAQREWAWPLDRRESGVFALGAAPIRISMRCSLGPAARGLLLGVAAGVLFGCPTSP